MAYFSNSSDSGVLEKQCDECRVPDGSPCPVLFVQMHFNYTQNDKKNKDLRDAMTSLIDESGLCLMKKELDKIFTGYVDGEEADTAQKMLDSL